MIHRVRHLLPRRGGVAFMGSCCNTDEYAFEMATSTVRFGRGVTKEVGYDLKSMGAMKNVCVVTDPYMATLAPMEKTLESLRQVGVEFKVFDGVLCEPTDVSVAAAVKFARSKHFEAYVAVGGGSVIDTAKAMNLYACHPDADLLEFINAPIGKGTPVKKKLKPLIAIPTTAGTGSETTGVSIFDIAATGAKTGIRDRAIRPTLGIIDPNHTLHCGPELTAFTGLDVLCHALESFTAVPFRKRSAAPATPDLRPAYQGSNPIGDIWSAYALQQCAKYLDRAVRNADDLEAREQMAYAATAAGVGFGNAGVHLCHAMSYPISSKVKTFHPATGYSEIKKNIVPHGLSVVLTAPAVFKWTASANYDRHLQAAAFLGADISNKKAEDSGLIIADTILNLLDGWRSFIPDGLKDIGYDSSDMNMLVKGTLPQKRVLDISPKKPREEDIHMLLDDSMRLFK